jgi:hypothetical protein
MSYRALDHDGRLRASDARLSVAAINIYRGDEIPNFEQIGLNPDLGYRMLRHPRELRKAARTFAGLPLYSRHHDGSDHRRDLVVGTLGSNVRFTDPYLVCDSVCVWDPDAIARIRDGRQRQISLGYRYEPLMRGGVYRGQRYDGVMVGIKGTHAALVREGRAGAACAL